MGVVGSGALSRLPRFALAISLAGAFCLPARNRWISLHGLDASSPAYLVNDSRRLRNPRPENNLPTPMWYSAGFRSQRTGLARFIGLCPRFRTTIAGFCGAFSMAGPAERVASADPPLLDGEMG